MKLYIWKIISHDYVVKIYIWKIISHGYVMKLYIIWKIRSHDYVVKIHIYYEKLEAMAICGEIKHVYISMKN